MKYLFALTIALAFMSCKTQKEAVEEAAPVEQTNDNTAEQPNKPQRPYQVEARVGKFPEENDAYEITNVRLNGNFLSVDVSYPGGCGWHKWDFIGNPALMKSLPPQRTVMLVHDNGGDQCEGMVNHTVEIDLRPLAYKQEAGSEIVLILDGFSEKINYIYE